MTAKPNPCRKICKGCGVTWDSSRVKTCLTPGCPAKAKRARWCSWIDTGEMWQSPCGVRWSFGDGGPKENGMTYCYKCGAKIETTSGALFTVACRKPAAKRGRKK